MRCIKGQLCYQIRALAMRYVTQVEVYPFSLLVSGAKYDELLFIKCLELNILLLFSLNGPI